MVEFGRFARLNSKRYGRKLETIYFLGFNIFGGLCKMGDFVLCFKTEKGRLNRAHSKIKEIITNFRHFPLRDQIKRINLFLSGHYRYYGLSTNIKALDKVYTFAYYFWKKSLSRRSQKGKLSWSKYERTQSFHPLLKPKIYVSFVNMRILASL